MDSKEYTKLALVTEAPIAKLNWSRGGLVRLLGVLALTADIADQAKKTIAYGKPLDSVTFAKRLHMLADQATSLAGVGERVARPEDAPSELFEPNLRVLHAGIGVFGEAGEILEAVIKQVVTGELDMVNVGEEGGDALWYLAVLADETGVPMDQNMDANIAKLKARYGDKFTQAATENRDLAAERTILEAGLATTQVPGVPVSEAVAVAQAQALAANDASVAKAA